MKGMLMLNPIVAAVAFTIVTAPAAAQQRPSTSSPAARTEADASADRHAAHDKREHCAAMEQKMGTRPMHDHSEMKGTVGISHMNRQHLECERMKKSAAHKK